MRRASFVSFRIFCIRLCMSVSCVSLKRNICLNTRIPADCGPPPPTCAELGDDCGDATTCCTGLLCAAGKCAECDTNILGDGSVCAQCPNAGFAFAGCIDSQPSSNPFQSSCSSAGEDCEDRCAVLCGAVGYPVGHAACSTMGALQNLTLTIQTAQVWACNYYPVRSFCRSWTYPCCIRASSMCTQSTLVMLLLSDTATCTLLPL